MLGQLLPDLQTYYKMSSEDTAETRKIHSLHKLTKASPQIKQCVAGLSIPPLLIH